MSRLFLIELGRDGHQPAYLALAVSALSPATFERVVVITWRDNLRLADLGNAARGAVALEQARTDDPATACMRLLEAQRCSRADTVLVLEGDRALSLPWRIRLRFGARPAFLWFRPNLFREAIAAGSLVRRSRNALKWLLLPALALSRFRVGFIDEWNAAHARRLWLRACHVPDPARVSVVRRPVDAVRSGSGTRTVLSIGRLDERKGVFETLAALDGYDGSPALRYRIVGSGTQDFDTRLARALQGFSAPAVSVERVAERVSDEQFTREIAAADVVMVNYPGFLASSGVLNLALAAGRAAVGYRGGVIGRRLEAYPRGRIVCDGRLREAILGAAVSSAPDGMRYQGAGVAEFRAGLRKLVYEL